MKKAKLLLTTIALTIIMCMTAFAGEWQQDSIGWWYQNDDGTYAKNEWVGNYYCGSDGYMLVNTTTPDGYTVGADGAWDGNAKNDGSYYSEEGMGDKVVSGLVVSAPSYLNITNDGNSNFSIWAHYGDEKYDKELLVNTIGGYSGIVYLQPEREYTLEIKSSGNWSVKAYLIEISVSDTFSGAGDYVTPMFIPSSNVYAINGGNKSNFTIWGHYGPGERDKDLLVNEIGKYSGTVMFKHKTYSFFEINCDGEWSIMPQ